MKIIKQRDRKSIRLKEYDYSQPGEYFVTICTHDHECTLGKIVDGEMQLNEIGKMVKEEWLRTPNIRPGIELDLFVIMPNHIHGIIVIKDESPILQVGTHSPPNSMAGKLCVPTEETSIIGFYHRRI